MNVQSPLLCMSDVRVTSLCLCCRFSWMGWMSLDQCSVALAQQRYLHTCFSSTTERSVPHPDGRRSVPTPIGRRSVPTPIGRRSGPHPDPDGRRSVPNVRHTPGQCTRCGESNHVTATCRHAQKAVGRTCLKSGHKDKHHSRE